MSLSCRLLRRSVLCLLCMLPGLCAAQTNQFVNLVKVQPTGPSGSRATSFVSGTFQNPSGGTDLLYLLAPTGSGTATSILAGELLNQGGSGFADLAENQIHFTGVTNVAAAVGSFLGSQTGYAFALTPTVAGTPNLCIYLGTGAQPPSPSNPAANGNSYSGSNAYPPTGSKSGCMTLQTLGGSPPQFGYIAALGLQAGLPPQQLLVEDTVNGYLYVLLLNGASESGGVLSGVTLASAIHLAAADGPGPIYVGDFNGDGNMDFIVNGQTGYSATVYLGNGGGAFTPLPPNHFDANVRSMLMYDMDGATNLQGNPILDMVVEGNSGAIEIFKGNGDGTFQSTSEGGTGAGSSSLAGDGGRLAAINPNTLDILTTTPIGLSLLQRQSGTLTYGLTGIYNIGSGRSSFALADFYGTGNLDLAVDSAEGVAFVVLNGNGTLQTSNAYSALAPALSAVVGTFRDPSNNPSGVADVAVAIGAAQSQLLLGNGGGAFTTASSPTPAINPATIPPNLWSHILAGEFAGTRELGILYSLTGLPLPSSGTGILVQPGSGNGTFSPPSFPSFGQPANNTLYGESAVGDFNGDGITDVANIDAAYDDVLLGQSNGSPFAFGLNLPASNNTDFSQVATGFFKVDRTSQQDVVFQQGTSFLPYKNAQDMTGSHFTPMPALTGPGAPLHPSAVLLTDVDGDGYGDLVVVYYNATASTSGAAGGQVYLWWGNGDGTFVTTPLVLTLSRDYSLGAVADMNADGLPDLVLSDGSLLSILYNQGARSFGSVLSSGMYSSEQHFLAGQGINSIALADVSGDGVPDVVVANGGVTNSNAVVLNGNGQTSIALTPNPSDIDTGGITVLFNGITTKPVTGMLAASPEPSAYQAAFTLTATLTPSAGVAAPTGTVQFYANGATLGNPVTLVPGAGSSTATYVVPANNGYAPGALPLTAIYSGDNANSGITLSDTHQITDNSATTTVLYLCAGPTPSCPATGYVMPPQVSAFSMYYGQDWNGTVVVTAADGGALPGTIDIYDAYTGAAASPPAPLCVLPVAGGGSCPAAVGTTEGTSVGSNVITAVYVPGANDTHTGSTSSPVTITVLQDLTSGPALAGTPNPSPLGQPVTFTAMLTGNYAAPTGPVTFIETFPPATATTILGTANLTPGTGLSSTATFTTSALPLGTDTITASYAATQNFAAATFPVITETITPSLAGSFTISVTPTPVNVGVGASAVLAVTVTPQNGFSQPLNLTCANLPSEAFCSFGSTTLTGGGGTTSLVIATTAPHSCGTTQPYFIGLNGGSGAAPFALPAIAGLLSMFVPGRRRWLRGLVALLVVAGVSQMSGCGNCTDLGTRPATYTFQVTGTATETSEMQSQPVTITVTI
jgi:hypothetical protein